MESREAKLKQPLVAGLSYCGESLVHLRARLLHSGLLNEAACQLTVVLCNPGCSLFHHLPLLRSWCLRKKTQRSSSKKKNIHRSITMSSDIKKKNIIFVL